MGLETMKYNELKKLDDAELIDRLELNKNEYIDKKLKILNNLISDTSVLKKCKKDTARIKTLSKERKNHE